MKLQFSIRKADVDDCSLIRNLAAQIWEPTYGHILSAEQLSYMFEMMYSLEHIRRQMTEQWHQYFIVYVDKAPSGYLSIERKSTDVFIFQKIYILPELHGKGCGRYLFEQGVAFLQTLHPAPFVIELYVNRNNPAVGFYERLGMLKTATRDHPIGDGYFMNDYIMTMSVG